MRYRFRFWFAFALGLALMAGCSDENGGGGSGGTAGTGGMAGTGGSDLCAGIICEDTECKIDGTCNPSDGMCDYTLVEDGTACSEGECLDGVCAPIGAFPCTEQGIRDAIAEGGGPHFFACDGPTMVVIGDRIEIDEDVILDGEGNLTVDGSFRVNSTTELRRLNTTNGPQIENNGTLTFIDSVISNHRDNALLNGPGAAVTLIDSTVSDNGGAGIYNYGGVLNLRNSAVSGNSPGIGNIGGTVNVVNSTVSGNTSYSGAGISSNGGSTTLLNSTVSGNTATREGGGIEIAPTGYYGVGTLTIISSTIWGNFSNSASAISTGRYVPLTIANTLLGGNCAFGDPPDVTSLGHNIESPGNTCGLDQATDQISVSMNIGSLQDNGGPTMTHAGFGFPAIDRIPAEDCVDADGQPLTTDQRGEPRPVAINEPEPKCDVGAVELQPDDLPP